MRYHAIAIILLMISAPLAGCTADEGSSSDDVDDTAENIGGTSNETINQTTNDTAGNETTDGGNGTIDGGNGSSDAPCWKLLQEAMEYSHAYGNFTYTNYTYDSDCRVIVSELTPHGASHVTTYLNTTYDSDGNIAIIHNAVYLGNWSQGSYYDNITYNYTGGLLTQVTTETSNVGAGDHTVTNYTYDSDDRVIVSETMGTTYLNTTYDSDGNIAITQSAVQTGQGWYYDNITYNYTGGLLTQSTLESTASLGSITYTNYTYDSSDRVIVSETMGTTYLNTTYDSDGNIATLQSAVYVNGNWYYVNWTYLWGEP